jgi:FkbM family methyltransferase
MEISKSTLEKPSAEERQPDPQDSGEYGGHPDQFFGHITYSQFGEDLIVANIFALLGISRPSYLDVGAHHPLHISNTALMHKRGSCGINVEANPNLIGAFHRLRPNDVNLNIGVSTAPGTLPFYMIDATSGRNTFDRAAAEAFVRDYPSFTIETVINIQVVTLDSILEQYMYGQYPDFLSIDLEGLDYQVLKSANLAQSGPKVICVEVESAAPGDDGGKIVGMLKRRGYSLFARTVSNAVMVRSGLLPA